MGLLALGLTLSLAGPIPVDCRTVAGDIGRRACVDAPGGIVIAATPVRAAELATIATAGEARFRTHFAVAVPSYAVVENDGSVDATLSAALTRRGVAYQLPWLSSAAMAQAMRDSITRAVAARGKAAGLSDAQVTAMVDAALAQQADRLTPATAHAREVGTLPHELGHGWLIRGFWANAPARPGDHYGGPAPDWLDEAAAVLMEDAALAARRRQQFDTRHAEGDASARAKLGDLSVFLTASHPALPGVAALTGQGGGVRVLTGDEAARIAASAGSYYLTARRFADYLIARTGDPTILAAAARAYAAGQSTEAWLARAGLPATIPALQADWDRWLAEGR